MALSLLPTAALADEGPDTNLPAADENGVITLTNDVTITGQQWVIAAGETLTLDLNGRTMKISKYTAEKGQVLVKGTLTVKDSSEAGTGKICSDYTGTSGRVIDVENGTLILQSGKITMDGMVNAGVAVSGSAVYIGGTGSFKMDGGEVAANNVRASSAVNVKGSSASFEMTGGSVTAEANGNETSIYAVSGSSSSIIKISAGTISAPTALSARTSNSTITGGTFTGTVTVKTGSITGGTFDTDVSSGLADGLMLENGQIVPLTETGASAKIGDTLYLTFDRALVAAHGNDEIVLLKNVALTKSYTIDKAITLNLNTFEIVNSYAPTKDGFYSLTLKGATTIKNGTYTATGTHARGISACNNLTLDGVTVNAAGLVGLSCSTAGYTYNIVNSTIKGQYALASFDNNITLNITGSRIEGTGCGLYHNGSYHGFKLEADNTAFTSGNTAVYISGSSSTVAACGYHSAKFVNCTITGSTAVEIKFTNLTLENCDVEATGVPTFVQNNNGSTTDGFAVVSTDNTMVPSMPTPEGKIVISGENGKYKGPIGLASFSEITDTFEHFVEATYEISGGTFSSAVKPEYCAPGFEPKGNDDGTYGVKIKANLAAEVLDAQGKTVGAYNTLADAITAAKNGETVKLLKDVDENVTIPAGKTITLDLNGFTLVNNATAQNDTIADRKHTITNNGTLTIKDSVGGGIVDNVSHGCAAIKNNVGGTVTIENGTFCRTAEASTGADNSGGNSYYVIDNQGTMNINGGTFKFSDTKDGAYSSLIHNGWQDGTKNTGKTPAKMTITDGNFTQGTGGKITVKNDDYGELKIQGGTFTQPQEGYYCVLNWNVAEITGGTINGPVGCGGNGSLEGDKGKLTIGGTARIDGELQKNTSYGEPSISVTGGNFANSVKDYVVSDLTAELKRASGETPYSYYTDVAAAAAAAQPGDTVTDLSAQSETFTLTLKYNDGAAADTTYNVAGNTVVTLPAPKRSGYTFNGWYDGSKFYAAGASYTVSATVTLNASWSYISSGSSSYDPTYSVSTPSKTKNGTVTVSPKSASKGDTVTVTVKPDSGYVLETLTVTDKNGNELTLKDKGNGKYTFTMPAGKVEVKATFMEDNSMLNFFYDVPNNAYFYEAVKWAVKNGITTGVGNDLFAPEQPCTRAQIVTFLWRAAGSPEPKAASSFADVAAGSYYAKAVAWAVENGITTGTGDGKFSPDATCTRAQAVTFLARALNAKASGKAEFSDVPADSYFADAVAWAAANGVTEGIGGGLFGPDNDCTRGQIVTFLYRAYNK